MSNNIPLEQQENNSDIRGVAERLTEFLHRYEIHFQSKTRSVFKQVGDYIKGLFQGEPGKRNMERMAEVVPDSNDQALNHMLTDSKWSADAVRDQVARDVDKLLGSKESGLMLDETCAKKSGIASVGVARQWLGQYGKVDNGQVAVCAALAREKRVAMVDCRLYLPKEWTDDPERCDKAGIPKDKQVFKTKTQLALEMIAHQRKLGTRFAFVGVDGGYGKEPQFLRSVEDMNEIFMADVHKDQRIYLTDPEPFIPEKKGAKGRNPTRYVTNVKPTEVKDWAAAQPDAAWQRVKVGDGDKGEMLVDTLHCRVWLWDGEEEKARHWHLIVRREIEKPEEIKYSLSNAQNNTSTLTLAKMQALRYWIERSFQDAKSECGMDEYQVRKWQGWQHHMALVFMAMLFMLEERAKNKADTPLLSCFDIRQLLAVLLPKRNITVDEVIYQMEKRHKKRAAATRSAARRKAAGEGFATG